MNKLDKYKQLAEKQKREKAKIEGRLEALYEELLEEGYKNEELAEKDMITLGKKIEKSTKIFDSKLAQFEEKYAKELSQANK